MSWQALEELPFVEQFVHLDEVDSTNLYARRLSRYPADGVTLIAADRQHAGRGQRGNTFFSAIDGGIWASLVAPLDDLSSHFVLNRAMSLAIFDMLVEAAPGLSAAIKWPNDIYVEDRKICGILLETLQRERRYLVTGFGVNVNLGAPDLPRSLRATATSLQIETGNSYSIPALLYATVSAFERYRLMPVSEAHEKYAKRLYGVGRRVRVGDIEGIFRSVGEDGRARIAGADRVYELCSGPVRFVTPEAMSAKGRE